jgi:membrane dipeptidase
MIARLLLLALLLAGCGLPFREAPAGAAGPTGEGAQDRHAALVRQVLSGTPLVDGHNDLPWAIRENRSAPGDVAAYDLRSRTPGQTDIPRLRAGMVGVQFWSVYTTPVPVNGGAARAQLEQIDIARQVVARYPDVFELTLTADAAEAAFRRGRIGSVLGLEGGHALENSLGALRAYYDLGVRYLTLTHSENTDWADSATDTAEHGGLSEFGREVVRELNRLGVLVDLSHVSDAAMNDALDVSEAPVIFSHSSARAVTDHPRNVPDAALRRVAENGGVVMVTFVPMFVNDSVLAYEGASAEFKRSHPAPRAQLADVVRHLEHVRRVAGADHVGIGGDFDGIERGPLGLEDVSGYPTLFAELSRRGWSEQDLRKLAGENILRTWRGAEVVAARLQRERGPSTRTIQELDGR